MLNQVINFAGSVPDKILHEVGARVTPVSDQNYHEYLDRLQDYQQFSLSSDNPLFVLLTPRCFSSFFFTL